MSETYQQPTDDRLLLQVLQYLRVVARRKTLILSITAATAIGSAAYSLTLPNVYTATVKVLPPQKDGGGISSMLGQLGGLAMLAGAGKGGVDSDLYLGILKSRSVGEAVIQRLGLTQAFKVATQKEAWGRLEGAVRAQTGKDGMINISVDSTDPKLAAQIANTMADELGRTLVRLNLSKAGTEKVFLEKRLEVVKRDLKNAEEELKAFSQRTKIVRIEAQAGASVSSVVRLKTEIASKEVQLAVLRNSQTDQSHEVQALLAALAKLKTELAKFSGSEGGDGSGVPAIGNVPQVGLEYARRFREFKVQEAIFEQLSKQYELAKLNYAKDTSSLQVLDEALVPDRKSGPKRSIMVLMSTLVAFLCSVVAVLVREFLERLPDQEKSALQGLKDATFSLNPGRER